MRRLLTALALLSSLLVVAQDSVYVSKVVDEMTDKVSYLPSTVFIASDDEKEGFIIDPYVDVSKVTFKHIIVETFKMGSPCNEDNTLIFKFTDGTKMKLKSWNDFDCKASYFSINSVNAEILITKEISKAYFENGRSFVSGTFGVKNPRYFIQLCKSIEKLKK